MEPNKNNWAFKADRNLDSFFQKVVKPYIESKTKQFGFEWAGESYYQIHEDRWRCTLDPKSCIVDEEQFRIIVLEENIEPNYEIY